MLDLNKLEVMGDSLVYRGRIRRHRVYLVDDDGKRYPLIDDLSGEGGEVMKRLLDFYRKHSTKNP